MSDQVLAPDQMTQTDAMEKAEEAKAIGMAVVEEDLGLEMTPELNLETALMMDMACILSVVPGIEADWISFASYFGM